MFTEVQIAADFVTRLLAEDKVNPEKRQQFLKALMETMLAHFESHWDPQNPLTGNAFRSISAFSANKADPLVRKAAELSGIKSVETLLPSYFVLWCDPGQVAYRLGSDRSHIQIVYEDPSLSDLHGMSRPSSALSPVKSSPMKANQSYARPGSQRLLFQ